MREKLKTLPLATLRDMAKAQGVKGVSGYRKSELIDILCEEAERMEQEKAPETADGAAEAGQPQAAEEREAETARTSGS